MLGPLALKTVVTLLQLLSKCLLRKRVAKNDPNIQEGHEMSTMNDAQTPLNNDPERNEVGN